MSMLVAPAVMWTLDSAIEFVRELQPALHAKQWHCALGGGVINKGESLKDADIYILPFSDRADVPDIFPLLTSLWGRHEDIGYGSSGIYEHKVKFVVRGDKRIDVFIGRRGGATNA